MAELAPAALEGRSTEVEFGSMRPFVRVLSCLAAFGALAAVSLPTSAQGSLEWVRFGLVGGVGIPTPPSGVHWTKVASGGLGFVVALGSDGQVASVGFATNPTYGAQAPALPPGTTYTDVAAGFDGAWALRSDGALVRWGGAAIPTPSGVPQAPAGRRFVQLAPSQNFFLGLLDDGTVMAFGANNYGQLNIPALPAGLAYRQLAVGERHGLALRSDGYVVGFGQNTSGQCNTPSLPAGQSYTRVAATKFGSCALSSSGFIWTWGQLAGVGPDYPPAGQSWSNVWCCSLGFAAYAASDSGLVRPFGQLDAPSQPGAMAALPTLHPDRRYAQMNGLAYNMVAATILDCDDDGLDDALQLASGAALDCDSNGRPDACDIASGALDANGDGVPDGCVADCNQNGILDVAEVASGAQADCDHDLALDACEIAAGAADCDADGALDACSLAGSDCDGNGRLDRCDVAAGATDCDANLVPDACQLPGNDCDLDGRLDSCNLAAGGVDCDHDLVLDACELAGADCDGDGRLDACQVGGLADCDLNGVRDWCDVATGAIDCDGDRVPDACQLFFGNDCNQNQRLDACDIASGMLDANGDGLPDGCHSDCDGNGAVDASDIASGAASDCDRNGRPDACDLLVPGADANGDGRLDRCVGGVVVVAPIGGDYADVQAAINASVDGDTILVRPGAYPGFAVANRDLRIVGATGRLAVIQGAVRVRNLAAGKTVVLDGLNATGLVSTLAAERHGLYISNCAGSVRVQDCEFRSQTTQAGSCDAIPAIGILSSGDVVLSGVEATTPVSSLQSATPLYAAAGLRCEGSTVAAFGCRFVGGRGSRYGCVAGCTDIPGWESGCGAYQPGCDGTYGGPGVEALGGVLHLDGCTLVGGQAGSGIACAGICGSCVYGGDGGDGLRLRNGGLAFGLDCAFEPGASSGNLDSTEGSPQRVLTSASYAALAGASRVMELASPAREGSTSLLQCRGEPGDFWSVALTRGTTLRVTPPFASVQVFQHPGVARFKILGSMPQSGRLDAVLLLPQLATEGSTLCVQPFVRSVGGQFQHGTPLFLTVLDQGY